jgi:hypothetical protein
MQLKPLHIIPLFGLLLLSLMCNASKKKTDWRKSFEHNNKNPYGTFLAYSMLPQLFPNATINDTKKIFSEYAYDDEGNDETNKLKIIIAENFYLTHAEINRFLSFIKKGNYVMISAADIERGLLALFNVHQANGINAFNPYQNSKVKESIDGVNFIPNQYIKLFPSKDTFKFDFTNGLQMDESFNVVHYKDGVEAKTNSTYNYDEQSEFDEELPNISSKSYEVTELGNRNNEYTNYIMIRYGKGKLFIHCAPLLLSNYFLLQKNNRSYWEKMCSFIPADVEQIEWHQFYNRNREYAKHKEQNIFGSLWQYPMWRIAILLTVFGLLLYVLFNSKRRQREIPIIPPTTNNSLEFVETIGQLYYNKLDHKNISEKMIAHLLEKIRGKYNVATNKVTDEDFINVLALKSGANKNTIVDLMNTINTCRSNAVITETQLVHLYKQIQIFNQFI